MERQLYEDTEAKRLLGEASEIVTANESVRLNGLLEAGAKLSEVQQDEVKMAVIRRYAELAVAD